MGAGRFFRRPVVLVGVLGLGLVAASCGSGGGGSSATPSAAASRGGTLNMLGSGDVDYMDPNISYYTIGYLNLRMWSRELFSYPAVQNQTTKPVPDLATAMPTVGNGGVSADGKTYTITIRSGAKWDTSPARQVAAQDVARGLKRTCNPIQPFGGTPDFASLIVGYQSFCDGFAKVKQDARDVAAYVNGHDISGVTAKNDRTVVFHLTHPATYFVDMLTLPAFAPVPREMLAYAPASLQLARHTVSDGPYQVQSYSPTKQIVYTRNKAWDPATDPIRKAYVDKIVVNETVSQESAQQQLETGSPSADMEFDDFPPPSQLPTLIAKKDPLLNLGITASSNPYVVFNLRSPNNRSALKNLDVRQALMYAIDRTHLVQALGGPKVNPPLTHVLPSSINGSAAADPYPHDVAKAKQLLAKAGYANGLTLKFLYRNATEGNRKIFATLQQDLKQVGVTVKGVGVPNADFYTKYVQVPSVASRGVWDLALAGWGPDWYGDAAASYFGPLFSGPPSYPPTGSNFGFYDNSTVNKLTLQAESAKSKSAAATAWQQADQQVMRDAAIYPITSPMQPNYHAVQVHGAVYVPAIQNFDPTNVWLAKGAHGG